MVPNKFSNGAEFADTAPFVQRCWISFGLKGRQKQIPPTPLNKGGRNKSPCPLNKVGRNKSPLPPLIRGAITPQNPKIASAKNIVYLFQKTNSRLCFISIDDIDVHFFKYFFVLFCHKLSSDSYTILEGSRILPT
jgi:hypothetical protein